MASRAAKLHLPSCFALSLVACSATDEPLDKLPSRVESRNLDLGIGIDSGGTEKEARVFVDGSGVPGEDHLHWPGRSFAVLRANDKAWQLYIDPDKSSKHVHGLDGLAAGDFHSWSGLKGPGADTVGTLFYMGHGSNDEWQVGGKSVFVKETEFGDQRLRYLWMCSCYVMAYPHRASHPLSQPRASLPGDQSNLFWRWGHGDHAPVHNEVRMACGGETFICGAYRKPLIQTWDWILNKGYPIADAFVLGQSDLQRRGLCLSRGSDLAELPLLIDFEFLQNPPPRPASRYLFALYPVVHDWSPELECRTSTLPLETSRTLFPATVASILVTADKEKGEGPCATTDAICSFYNRDWEPKLPRIQDAPTTLAERHQKALDYALDRGLPADASAYCLTSVDLIVDRTSATLLGTGTDLERLLKGTVFRFRRRLEAAGLATTAVVGMGGEVSVLVDPGGEVQAFSKVWRTLDGGNGPELRPLLSTDSLLTVATDLLADDRYRASDDVRFGFKEHPATCEQDLLEPYFYVLFEPKDDHPNLPPREVEVFGFEGEPSQTACSPPRGL